MLVLSRHLVTVKCAFDLWATFECSGLTLKLYAAHGPRSIVIPFTAEQFYVSSISITCELPMYKYFAIRLNKFCYVYISSIQRLLVIFVS